MVYVVQFTFIEKPGANWRNEFQQEERASQNKIGQIIEMEDFGQIALVYESHAGRSVAVSCWSVLMAK